MPDILHLQCWSLSTVMLLGDKTHMFILCLPGFAACYKCYSYRDWLPVYVTSMRIGCMSMLRLQGLAAYLCNVYKDWLHVYVTATGIGCLFMLRLPGFMLRLQGLAAYLCYGYREWLPTFLPDDQGRVTCDLLQPHLLGSLDQPREVDRQFGARAAPSVFLSQEHICTK